MTYSASGKKPQYDIVLRDSAGVEVGLEAVNARGEHDPASIIRTPVERSSLKMSQGNQSYSDLEPPYTVLAQDEGSGGRGGRTFEDDVTRFRYSVGANTGRQGKIILNGRETYSTGNHRSVNQVLPGSMRIIQLVGAYERMAVKFTTPSGYDAGYVMITLGYKGTPGTLTVALYTNSGTVPGALVASETIATSDLREETITEMVKITLSPVAALANATSYHLVIYGAVGTTADHWKVGVSDTPGNTQKSADDGANWTASAYGLYYRVLDTTAAVDGEFFIFNDYMYFVTKPSAGTSILWAVSALDSWADVTPAAFDGIVTDLAICNKLMFFAQGSTKDLFALKGDYVAGFTTRDELAKRADFLEAFNDETGRVKIVRVLGTVANIATEPTWGTDAAWAGTAQVGRESEAVTGVARYATDDGAECAWIMKDSGPWEYDGTYLHSKASDELRAVASSALGAVTKKSDVYLFMSIMNTIWRFYSPTFDDVGFMLDEGLPTDLRGTVSCIVPYPGRTLVSINAGTSGYSTILENNGGSSWHEIYRAPKGERIYSMGIQVVDGTALDKLWIKQEADFVWVPLPSNGFDPIQDTAYTYVHEGVVELCDMYAGIQTAWKYWSALKLILEDLVDDTTWVEADYKLEDGEWTAMPSAYTEQPIDEKSFGETDGDGRTYGVSSKKFRLRVRLYSVDTTKTPTVRGIIAEAVTVNAPKFTYSLIANIGRKDLNGDADETLEPYEKVEQLDTWSGTAQSLWMTCINPLFDGRAVFLEPVPNRPLTVSEHEGEYTYTTTIVLQEA